jgi:ornithine cyclodeaminase/alanine dehydrogenase
MLHLSEAEVAACGITPAAMNAAVEAAFLAASRGRATTRPALSIPAGGAASFRAKGGVLLDEGFGAVKWYGYFPGNAAAGVAEFRPLVLLNEAATGLPVAIMGGDLITAMRTAAITAVGAKHLARPGSSTIGFVGCGTQARANLRALLPIVPLRRALLHGNRAATMEAFASFVRQEGLAAEIVADPRDALAAEIVVTTVPRLSPRTAFLHAADVPAGTFVSMVDSGVSWAKEGLEAFALRVSDDPVQSTSHAERGDAVTSFHAGLPQVVAGRVAAAPDDRRALIFSGTGLADVAAAVLVYRIALARGIGRQLPF